jgi:hypothetical protein
MGLAPYRRSVQRGQSMKPQIAAYVLATALVGAGAFAVAQSTSSPKKRMDEKAMQEKAPKSIPGHQMIPGPEGLAYSYKMPDSTYHTLKPYGIVAQTFTDGNVMYDVVLISSDNHESFHDPKICFSGQGWTFNSTREESIKLADGRMIPATIVEMQGPTGESSAVYFYKGPSGFRSKPQALQLDMFKEVLFGRKPTDSTFYRFMPSGPGVTLEQLKGFIKTYMVSAASESGGFF